MLEPHAERWHKRARGRFSTHGLPRLLALLSSRRRVAEFIRLLDAFLLEKALYEVAYELNNRPAWLGIPLRGAVQNLRGPG